MVNTSVFDESYIEFLDRMIQIGLRGPKWTALLGRRRAALLPYCGVELLNGHVQVGDVRFWVKVDPKTVKVIYWEET